MMKETEDNLVESYMTAFVVFIKSYSPNIHYQLIFYYQCSLLRNPCDCPACETPEPKGKKRKRVQPKVSPKKVKQNHSDLLSRVSKDFDEILQDVFKNPKL